MNPPRTTKPIGPRRYGPAPQQGRLSLGADMNGCSNKLEKRLVEDPELLRRIAEAAVELGGDRHG